MRIAIIGGGLTGLVIGFQLGKTADITIYERDETPGGLLSSYRKEGYTIERFYHHFFSGDTSFLELVRDLGLDELVLWLKGSTGTYMNGSIYPLTTPLEIIRYPWLSLRDKIKLGLFTRKARSYDIHHLDSITAREFIIQELGESLYKSFFEPLLKSKFGYASDQISAAWLVSRVAIRSDRGATGERLGYLERGFDTFVSVISSEINKRGNILYNTPVTSLIKRDEGWLVNDIEYDIVITTISPPLLKNLGISHGDIPYQGAACVTLALPRDVTDGLYWINLYDSAPYGAVIGHTNFAPFEWYGEHLVYLASYFSGVPPSNLKEIMIEDFCRKFTVKKSEISWSEIAVDPNAGPLYTTGYLEKMRMLETKGLFCAGMFSPENYPERSIEGCVRAANRVVRAVLGN